MTLTEINALCPVPEGHTWTFDEDYAEWTARLLPANLVVINDAGHDGTPRVCLSVRGNGLIVSASADLPDLPAAYHRALQAVGLEEDLEKVALKAAVAELRRRLAWSEEVPTTNGRYLVDMPMRSVVLWTRSDYRPGKPWCSSTSGWCAADVFPEGTRFLPLANLKEPG